MPSGAELARRTGWVQPKVSRLETGAQLPTEDDLRTWVEHTGASGADATELLDMLSAARFEYVSSADLLARGALGGLQGEIGAMEAAATRIGEYQPAFLPGLVQVPDYSRAVLELPGMVESISEWGAVVDQIVAARAARQVRLAEPGRRWQFVVGEAALWSAPGSRDVQAEQLAHLATMAEQPGVEVGLIPLRAPMAAAPLSGFRLLDEEFVFVESIAGEQRIGDPTEVAPFVQTFEALRAAAVTGAEAAAEIHRVAAELRRGPAAAHRTIADHQQ